MKRSTRFIILAILQVALLSAVAEHEPADQKTNKPSGGHKRSSKELIWDANRPEERIVRYNVYEKVVDRKKNVSWKKIATVNQPRYTLPRLSHGTHIFAVTSVGPLGESERSQELVVQN